MTACGTARFRGKHKRLFLNYDPGQVKTGYKLPIARGATVTYDASSAGDPERSFIILSARSDNEDVVSVVEVKDGKMTLRAGEADMGDSALVEVTARGYTGRDQLVLKEITDVFEVRVATPNYFLIGHACGFPKKESAYFVNSDIGLDYYMSMKELDGALAIGHGYYPFVFEPEDGAALRETTVNNQLPMRTGSQPGEVEVVGTTSKHRKNFMVVEPAEVTGLSIVEQKSDTILRANAGALRATVGARVIWQILPQIGSVSVCQSDVEMQVENSTPGVCEVEYGRATESEQRSSKLRFFETNHLRVKGIARGACRFKVRMPEAKHGDGVELDGAINFN